jgi:hypothetical protein
VCARACAVNLLALSLKVGIRACHSAHAADLDPVSGQLYMYALINGMSMQAGVQLKHEGRREAFGAFLLPSVCSRNSVSVL